MANPETERQYRSIVNDCRTLFANKTRDYGTAWRVLRLPSITDQLFIKAKRIRSIQEKGTQKVQDPMDGEFVGLYNYCIIALMQIHAEANLPLELSPEVVIAMYDKEAEEIINLLNNKNHDYDEAWRDMRVSSMTDIILMKLLRVKQIEDLAGQTLVSEGVEANYRDIANYAVFCLIQLKNP